MKRILLFIFVLAAFAATAFCATVVGSGSTLADSVSSAKEIIQPLLSVQSGYNAVIYFILLVSIFVGILIHTIWNVRKAVKNKTTTPNYFSFSYWLNENLGYKITLIFTTLSGVPLLDKYLSVSGGWSIKIIAGILGLLIGFFLDKLIGVIQAFIKIKAGSAVSSISATAVSSISATSKDGSASTNIVQPGKGGTV